MTDWLQKLLAKAEQPPLLPRHPFIAQNIKIGSVEPVFMDQLALEANQYGRNKLLIQEQSGWHLVLDQSDLTTRLNQLAGVMRAIGLAGAWRDEQLAVCDEQGVQLGTIERGAVRPLGIATLAVHLVGQSTDGRFWVQQRAFDKPNDPGQWDTLMGGMVSAKDTVETALQRETWEEAGLNIANLQDLRYGGRQGNCRPSSDGVAGYMQEFIEWYVATVPESLTPNNQDGEVAQFVLMDDAQLLASLQRGEFTIEAALILANVLNIADGQSIS